VRQETDFLLSNYLPNKLMTRIMYDLLLLIELDLIPAEFRVLQLTCDWPACSRCQDLFLSWYYTVLLYFYV